MSDQYVIETNMGPVQLLAADDTDAVVKAKEWLKRTGIQGSDLWRYPLCYVDKLFAGSIPRQVNGNTAGLIWVPLFNFVKL